MNTSASRYVYGPVPSRRLGRSLGVDLVPFKTCSYDCIYCQLGRTTNKTTEIREYVPVDRVLDELSSKVRLGSPPDFIGLAGSGEPTLHARIGDLISGIKKMTSVPVAVLTNGSMLWVPEVRASLAEADLVLPSLDVGDQRVFDRVNRPHEDISFDRMAEGLIQFAQEYRGPIWLEVFVLAGITDLPDELRMIAALAKRIHPARVQLNTVSRPTSEGCAVAASVQSLEELRRLFAGFTEVIGEGLPSGTADAASGGAPTDDIVALVSRRPCTVEGISAGLGLRPNEVVKHLGSLCRNGVVLPERRGADVFYKRGRKT
ncbi:MAG: radical SAM protein [Rhodospirillales bacterium]|jgi:wyosine [tRNA(Phe)-imidazoG37] synthetase (radical SAM superfamily)|nr:radical SAM protein [Rhodospirillales bacterium]